MALLPLKNLVLHTKGDRVASLFSEAAGILSIPQNVEVRSNGHVHCLAHEFY